jgi:hypothetical protein
MTTMTSGNGGAVQFRLTTSGLSTQQNILTNIAPPYWVKLVKKGQTYAGFVSPDGNEWTSLGDPLDVGFGSNVPVYAGIAVTSHNINKLTKATVSNYLFSGLLDIQLQDFSASLSLQNKVTLTWVTTLEHDIASFVVTRSKDNLHYDDIDTVAAVNNGNITTNYTSEDQHPPDGTVYYRLTIMDTQDRVSFSAPITVVLAITGIADAAEANPKVYPNPPKDGLIYVQEGADKIRMITIFDPAGKAVSHTEGSIDAVTEIPVRMMANGLYVVEIRTVRTVYRDKVVIRN